MFFSATGNALGAKQSALWGRFDVEMMGFLGMGNNPMVGATVSVAVAVEQAMKG